MKKIIALTLALVMVLALSVNLASCKKNNPSDNNPANEPPVNEPFSIDLAGYVANIGNATALGISKRTTSSTSPVAAFGKNNSGIQLLSYALLDSDKDTENKNYIVMSTTDYDANAPEADKTGLTKVTFTKIVTENVTTETTGTKYIIATKGTISISAIKGFKYTIYRNGALVYSDVQDNDVNDKDSNRGIIVLDNLIDGVEYKVDYNGVGVETTITQDEINGEIDKLYILNGYTFISFVPTGTSQRPTDDLLTFDTDGIAHYDKCDYFSNETRQSFVIDNSTGYVYQINNFNIKEIQGGCLVSADDNFIYDFKINANNELEIFSLFTNDTIEWYSCFKDKYGNKFIQNNRLNTYDTTTNTYFYVFEPFVSPDELQYCGNAVYELTSTGEAIALIYPIPQYGSGNDIRIIEDAYIVQQNGQKRSLTREDTFEIYYDRDKINELSYMKRTNLNSARDFPKQDWSFSYTRNRAAFKVENGVVYGYNHHDGYSKGLTLMKHDAVSGISTCITHSIYGQNEYYNVGNLEEHNILIEFRNGNLYYYKNVWDAFEQSAMTYDEAQQADVGKQSLDDYAGFEANLILSNCSLDCIENAILAYGVNGNTYYDIVAEEVNGEVVIKQYVKGTYQKPQVKITLQPLNK